MGSNPIRIASQDMRWPAGLKAKCPFYGFYKKTPENYCKCQWQLLYFPYNKFITNNERGKNGNNITIDDTEVCNVREN